MLEMPALRAGPIEVRCRPIHIHGNQRTAVAPSDTTARYAVFSCAQHADMDKPRVIGLPDRPEQQGSLQPSCVSSSDRAFDRCTVGRLMACILGILVGETASELPRQRPMQPGHTVLTPTGN